MAVVGHGPSPGEIWWFAHELRDGEGAKRYDADGCEIVGRVIPTASFIREGHYFIEITPS